jgi:hypothetical protein
MTYPSPAGVLVLVKASLQPSRQYGDTVCVAGALMNAEPPSWYGCTQFRFAILTVVSSSRSTRSSPCGRAMPVPTSARRAAR